MITQWFPISTPVDYLTCHLGCRTTDQRHAHGGKRRQLLQAVQDYGACDESGDHRDEPWCLMIHWRSNNSADHVSAGDDSNKPATLAIWNLKSVPVFPVNLSFDQWGPENSFGKLLLSTAFGHLVFERASTMPVGNSCLVPVVTYMNWLTCMSNKCSMRRYLQWNQSETECIAEWVALVGNAYSFIRSGTSSIARDRRIRPIYLLSP